MLPHAPRHRSAGRGPRAVLLAACLATPLLAPAALPVPAAATAPAATTTTTAAAAPAPARVVVRGEPGGLAAVEAAVRAAGGTVTRCLPLVDGAAATLPAAALPRLAASPAVVAVTPDSPVRVQADGGDPGGAGVTGARAPSLRAIGADRLRAAGVTGAGVTVALVDTGVADVPDLAGRVVPVTDDLGRRTACQNLSGEPGCGDSYGHGTFLAGLVAGTGAASDGRHTGVAPGARVLSVKVAGRSGATDVSTVLAGIQWVVSFRDRYDVRVLNLSLGTDSTQSTRDDPLNYAVQKAWDAGITVVVSAANLGPAASTVTKPADDPYVLTVGSVDDRGTPGTGDDTLPGFSSRGPTLEGLDKPDVVAPGAHLVSLRAPGSLVDELFPDGAAGAYRRGSGTSMSAAVVSGALALLHEARSGLTADEAKAALLRTARPVASDDVHAVGRGMVDLPAAAAVDVAGARQDHPRSSGRGDLAASRGGLAVQPVGAVMSARQTAQLVAWDPAGFTGLPWLPATWYTSAHGTLGWNQLAWTGGDAARLGSTGPAETGLGWTGHNWGGHNWGGHNWGGSTWYGAEQHGPSYGGPGPASAWYGAWG